VTDEVRLRALFDVSHAVHLHDWPDDPGWQLHEIRALLRGADGASRSFAFGVEPGDAVAGNLGTGDLAAAGVVSISTRDNFHIAEVQFLGVLPAHRRAGAGALLLGALEDVARRAGRTVLAAHSEEPVGGFDQAPAAAASPVQGFALANGFAPVQTHERRDLDVPVEDGLLSLLEAACAPHAFGYSILGWQGRCPAELVEDRILLGHRMSTDAPTGDSARGEEVWDKARLDGREDLFEKMDRTVLVAGALDLASGRLVAFSELTIPNQAPERAYQWDTLVLKEHRGHRLGTLLKVANLRTLAEVSPATRRISTENASDNTAMIAVNDLLGHKVVARRTTWEKHLDMAADHAAGSATDLPAGSHG